jgi:hypothetical protein
VELLLPSEMTDAFDWSILRGLICVAIAGTATILTVWLKGWL